MINNNIVSEDIYDISSGVDIDRFRGKVVLISGAAGFLPAYMVRVLLHLNDTHGCDCRVVGIVRSMNKANARFLSYKGRPDFSLVECDVCHLVPLPRADVIIHAASPASPKFYGSDPVGVMNANLRGISNLLELARAWKSESFLFFSSGEVYGAAPTSSSSTSEEDYGYIDILNVRSCYVESKRAAETLAISYCHQYGVPCRIIRPFHTYGPGMALDDGRVFADFVGDIVNRRNISMKGDGSAIRAFCYLADAVKAFFLVLEKGRVGMAYNVGNPLGALSIAELADLLVTLFPSLGLKVEQLTTEHQSATYLVSPIARNVPNIDALNQLGWCPTYSPKEGFYRTVNSFLKP